MKDNNIILCREDGTEEQFKILCDFSNEQRGANYILVYKEETPEEVMIFEYFEDGTLREVEDEEILAEAQELLDVYDEEPLDEVEVPEI